MPRKILHELRIRLSKDGGHHVVEHRHDEAHDPELHKFRRSGQAVQHVLSQIDRLEPKGTMRPDVEEQGDSEPQPWAGIGSAREGSIQGRAKD